MFRIFSKYTNKVVVGRFDIHSTEGHKMIKAALANSDNCGDLICGDPKEVKDIIDYDNGIKNSDITCNFEKKSGECLCNPSADKNSWNWYCGKHNLTW